MNEELELRFPARGRYLNSVRSFLRALLRDQKDCPLDGRQISEIELGLQEACINAIRHGAKAGPADFVRVVFRLAEDGVTIEVHDHGNGFDLAAIPRPDAEGLQEGGYGIFIIRETMDLLDARRTDDGFMISFTKRYGAVPGPVWSSTA